MFFQKEGVTVDKAARDIQDLLNFVSLIRDLPISESKFVSYNIGIKTKYKGIRKKGKKKMLEETCEDDEFELTEEDCLENHFLKLLTGFSVSSPADMMHLK